MLPIFSVKQEILSALSKGSLVITAPTGSGKSTQVPRFLLEAIPENGRILILQPRRLAARMLAERVAFEMGVKLGTAVGYQTRYEKVFSSNTRLLFITEGILTRMLASEPSLPGISAIVFDEFHERSINTDLGVAMARHTKEHLRPDLKIVVMSATIDADPICSFLGNCTQIHAEGRIFDVEISYCTPEIKLLGPSMGAAKVLASLIASGKEGDVLIFMPGGYEIRKTIEACQFIKTGEKIDYLPLYGDLPPEAQRMVMNPSSNRKVIVATNIAETSLTIPGVRHVIDSGLARFNKFDPVRGVDSLETAPIAKDSADQRSGRAGREAPGTCQRLWTWLEQSAKPSRTIPEIRRVDLAEAVLAVNAFGFHDPANFPWFEAPPQRPLQGAQTLLEQLGYLHPNCGGLTELGRKLSSFPAHPRLSLLMWLGACSGCFNFTAWAAAILSERPLITSGTSPRVLNKERRHAAKQKAKAVHLPASDFLAFISLAEAAKDAGFAPDFCKGAGINPGAARDVCRAANDFISQGKKAGWDTKEAEAPELEFLKCILRSFPDRIAKRHDFGTLACDLPGGRHAELAKESVARDEPIFVAAEMREISASGTQATKLILSLASGIEEDWLLDFFPDDWEDLDQVFWDERRQQVVRRQTLSCLGLILEEKLRNDPDPEKAASILAQQLMKENAQIPNWDENVQRWIDRVRWTAALFPQENLPVYDDKDKLEVLKMLCSGETSLKSLKNKDTFSIVKMRLSYNQQQFVEKMAPAFLMLPNGRRMKIEYIPGQTPKGRSRIQDFYDLPQTPSVAGGKVKILLDILAPNQRTVQITDDLDNFWKVLYPKIKPELSRRYPRHLWK